MMLSIINVLVWLASVNSFESNNRECGKFIDRYYLVDDWKTIQPIVDCMSHQGVWSKQDTTYNTQCYEDLTNSCADADKNPSLSYKWNISPQCDNINKDFELDKLCSLMNSDTIMFIGDSISMEFGTSFLNAIYQDDPYQCNPDLTFFTTGMHEIKCTDYDNFHIQIVRNDRLSLVIRKTTSANTFIHMNKFSEFTWIPLMTIIQPAILVLNRGAHFENTSTVLESLDHTFAYITEHHPNTTIIWRNTPRGVEDQKKTFFDAPLDTPPDPRLPSIYPYAYEQYHDQNIAIREFFAKYYPRTIYWDIAHSMSYRQDGHRDPLHYCIPGPMDTWPWLLYNILMMIRSKLRLFDSLEECSNS